MIAPQLFLDVQAQVPGATVGEPVCCVKLIVIVSAPAIEFVVLAMPGVDGIVMTAPSFSPPSVVPGIRL